MERWPPAYDADDLLKLIETVRDRKKYPQFFDSRPTVASRCQGDVIRLPSEIPIIDKDGRPAITEECEDFWLVIGNTCDFERELTDLQWTQLVPLVLAGDDESIDPYTLGELIAYRMSRYFYIPDWLFSNPTRHFMAQLTMPVTVDKSAVLSSNVEARLSRSAWILLNACLVRFLARDDGRFAA